MGCFFLEFQYNASRCKAKRDRRELYLSHFTIFFQFNQSKLRVAGRPRGDGWRVLCDTNKGRDRHNVHTYIPFHGHETRRYFIPGIANAPPLLPSHSFR